MADVEKMRVEYTTEMGSVLIDEHGNPVETWRENYPYSERMTWEEYEVLRRPLQIELQKLQVHLRETGGRLCILFEGRDAAGKGGTIKRFTEHLNPRSLRVVALPAPTPQETSQWHFQRYVEHLPSAGEIVIFDRSWYNRAGVEKVMGFCTDEEYREFLRAAPLVEEMLVNSGISLVKFWFSVTQGEQHTRFLIRQIDPIRQWKMSPIDLQAIDRWDEYTAAKKAMFKATDTAHAPWVVVKSNDKKRARLEAMRYLLTSFDYKDKDYEVVGVVDPLIVPTHKKAREA